MSRQIITFLMKLYILAAVLLSQTSFPAFLHGQILIVDPPSISFHKDNGTTLYLANTSVLVKVFSDNAWDATCIAEPLIHASNGTQIPTDHLLLKHVLNEDYQPMNTTIDLGNGEPTGGQEMIINTLFFQISTTGQEEVGAYNGVVRFFLNATESAQLLLSLTIDSHINMTVSSKLVNFYTSVPAIYSGDPIINLIIEANTANWHVQASIPPSSANEYFSGSNVFIRSSGLAENPVDEGAGAGFQALENHPTILSGEQVGNYGSTELEFRIITDWMIRTGIHTVPVEFKIPEINYSETIDLVIQVQEYNIFSISELGVYFHANGPPAFWDGDKAVMMTVGSNCGSWTVVCEATNLVSDNDNMIPNSRLFMKIDPDDFTGNEGAGVGYHKLDTELEVASGSLTPPKEICEMRFKLQTLDIDRPGHYEGIITFTHLINP